MTVRCFFVQYLNAFLCGGVLCAVGQVLLDRTKLTPARILVCYVTAGVLLGGLGPVSYTHLDVYKRQTVYFSSRVTGW